MEENHGQPQDERQSESQPRRFVYRSVEPDSNNAHPLRRSTDTPREFQAIPGQLCPNNRFVKMRVYLKVN